MKRLSIFVDHRPQQYALQDFFGNRDLNHQDCLVRPLPGKLCPNPERLLAPRMRILFDVAFGMNGNSCVLLK